MDGGWGIDALLQQQTRPHKDFDALVQHADLATMIDVLVEHGFVLKEIWSENRWVFNALPIALIGRTHAAGSEVATAFVLKNQAGHELDVHVLVFGAQGVGVPAWDTGLRYPAAALTGRGLIIGTPVRCLSPQMQMATHSGYPLQPKDLHDLKRLHECFGTGYLAEQADHFLTPSKLRVGSKVPLLCESARQWLSFCFHRIFIMTSQFTRSMKRHSFKARVYEPT